MNIWMNELWIRLDILLLFNFLTGAAAYLPAWAPVFAP